MLHTKYISCGSHGFREEDFLSFSHYKYGSFIWAWQPSWFTDHWPFVQIFCPPLTQGSTWNLKKFGPGISEEWTDGQRDRLFFIVLGFNNTSTLVGHFMLSPRGREKRDRDSRGVEREGQERKRNRNESEEMEEIKTFPLYPYLLQG